jgi:hypothetical protein
MDPTAAAGFMSMPWPGDTRRQTDGSLDLTGFPGRSVSPLFDQLLAKGGVVTTGFGTNSAVYMQTTGALNPSSLPSAEQSVTRRSNVMLLDLDSPHAPPVPLLTNYKGPATRLRPANLIALLPYPGHPLLEDHRYVAVAFDGLVDTNGRELAPSPLLKALNGPPAPGVTPRTWSQLREERDMTIHAVRARTRWHPSEVVAFTVFTTQRITRELRAIAAGIKALPTPVPANRTTGDCTAGATQAVATGDLELPEWRAGPFPFAASGGQIVIGPDGRAIRQGSEPARFEMAWPCAPTPRDGWPILLYMNGTGAGPNALFVSELRAFGVPLPYVVLSIAPLYSADRFPPGGFPGLCESRFNPACTELLYFNFLNPVAGRTNQLAQAADVLYLERIAQGIKFAPGEGVAGVAPRIDRDTVVIAGHSQGAITLPETLAADPSIKAAFESSGGAGLYHTLVHRGDVRPIVDAGLQAPTGEIDMFHPAIQAIQTLAEIGDPANYARFVHAHLDVYAGYIDSCTPIETNIHLANALGIPIANPIHTPVFGSARFEPPVIALPTRANLAHRRTGVMVEVDDGHFGASANPSIGRSFVDSLATGGAPTVNPGPLFSFHSPGCFPGRPDPPPGR